MCSNSLGVLCFSYLGWKVRYLAFEVQGILVCYVLALVEKLLRTEEYRTLTSAVKRYALGSLFQNS